MTPHRQWAIGRPNRPPRRAPTERKGCRARSGTAAERLSGARMGAGHCKKSAWLTPVIPDRAGPARPDRRCVGTKITDSRKLASGGSRYKGDRFWYLQRNWIFPLFFVCPVPFEDARQRRVMISTSPRSALLRRESDGMSLARRRPRLLRPMAGPGPRPAPVRRRPAASLPRRGITLRDRAARAASPARRPGAPSVADEVMSHE
jgi:hypothetical protein